MREKIKILFLASSPHKSGRLRLDVELREIEKRILMAKGRDRFELISQWAVTPDDLQQALLRHKPHIVHFSGHGSPRRGIVLEDKFGNGQLISKTALIDLFKILKDNIRVIVLNACYAKPQAEGLSEVIDYTVGVQTTISDKAAILFAATFYQGLAYKRLVKDAYELARIRLKFEARVADSKLPELFVRAGDVAPGLFLPKRHTQPLPQPIITIILRIIGAVILIGSLYLTGQYINSKLEKASRRAHYTEAINQLSSQNSVTGRANAIENLGKLASDPDFNDYYEQIINTLVNFIRENSRPKKNGNALQDEKISDDVQAALKILGWRKRKWGDEGESQRLNLSDAFLRRADLKRGIGMEGAHLEGAQFNNSNLERAMLREVNLENAIFIGANLRYAILYKTNLQNADLRNADLEEADLQWAKGLIVEKVKEAKNWDKAIFSQEFEDKLRATH